MPFLTVSPINYRNLENRQINLSAKETFFIGENGQGKSNLLELLYFSAYGNSFRTRSDNEIICYGQKEFSVRSLFKDEESGKTTNIAIYYSDKKKIERNGKKITDRKELVNTIPCVLFCHDDIEFASGEPERRRFFIDQSLTMYDSLYVDIMRRYKKVLKMRNTILKEKKYELLEVLNEQLIQNGLEIQKKRKEAIYQFNLTFSDLYKQVTGIENVKIDYAPSWKVSTFTEVFEILFQKAEIDKQMCTTMSGPHRDIIKFTKDSKAFVPNASTGQRRLLSILLRINQALFYTNHTKRKPIFLMDDVLLELDPSKRQKVTSLLPEYDQLFCTFLPGEPYERYKKSTTQLFSVKNGICSEL